MEIKIGQLWSFKTERFQDNAVVIHHIEPFADDLISIHVTIINDVKVSESQAIGFGHFPFEQNSFKDSLNELIGTSDEGHETFKEGYKYWKNANGGVFTVSINEAIEMSIETNMNPDRVEEE